MKNTRIFVLSVIGFLVLGLLVSAPIVVKLINENNQAIKQAVNLDANNIAERVLTRLHLYQYGLRGARGAIIVAGESKSSRALFHRYSLTRNIESEFPGAEGFGFIKRVPAAEETDFVSAARLDGKPDFTIHQLAAHEGDRYVVQYVEPADRNSMAIGLDIASEINRRAAAEAAMRTGLTQLTAPITLIQARDKPQQSFLMLMPIYHSDKTLNTIKEREEFIFGWTYTPLLIQDILTNLSLDKETSYLTLRDITDPLHPETFYTSDDQLQMQNSVEMLQLERNIFGRKWQIDFEVNPLFIKRLHLTSPIVVFMIGGMISLMLGILAGGLLIQRQRDKKIHATQARLAAIVESSIDGIIGKDLNGVVTSWNKGAEIIFGYIAHEAIGKSLASLIVPTERKNEEEDILARIARGESISHFASIRRTRDGHLIPVSVSVAPIRDTEGKVIGASKTVRDITEQKAAEDRILDLNINLEAQVMQRTAQLELAKRNLQTILDAVPSLIGYWDKNLIIRVANHAYHTWFGLPPETIPGMSARELLGDKLFELNRPLMEAALRGEPQFFERAIPKPDGSGVRHSLAYYLPDISDGEVQGFHIIVHDVSEIKETNQRLERALRENQALLATIDKQLAYSVTNIDGNVIEVNENFCKLSGYNREELVGKNHKMFESETHPSEFWHKLWKTIAGGQSWQGEICYRTPNDELRWFDTVIAPFIDAEGKIERYVALHADITERKRAETERNQLSQLISNVLDAASEVAIIATNLEGTITIFNTGAELMLGYTAAEVIGKMSPAPFHLMEEVVNRGKELSDNYNTAIEGFRVFVHTSELVGSETRTWTYVQKSGSHIQVSLAVTSMRDAMGNITGYLGIATDVTKELLHERKLKSTIDQFAIATEVAELGVWSWNLETNAFEWNDRMYDIYSLPKDLRENGLSSGHWRARIHPEDVESTISNLMACIKDGGIYDSTFRVADENDKPRFIQARAQIERDKTGKALKVTGVNRDVTIQHELIVWLQQAKENADAASAAKSSFLANMSHEIRTPMNAVLGMLQLIQQTELTIRQQDYIDKTQTAAKSLLGLLNDILDFSKIDAGKLQLDLHPFELESLMRDVAVILSGSQQNKNLEVLFDLDASLPKIVSGDRLRLQQILINLGGNAIKFTPDGQVIISMKVLEQTSAHCTLRISVSDTGIGITPKQIERIFEGFVQAEASTTRRYGGTGLGLIISKHLVNLMGGNLQVESQLKQGSRFWFDISLDISTIVQLNETYPAKAPTSAHQKYLAGLILLVVEDNSVNRQVASELLEAEGAKVYLAEGGLEGVAMVLNGKQHFDLVIMDIQMPDIDGMEATTRIRTDARFNNLPILAMTANASPTDREACLNAGMSDHIGKPIDIAEVVPRILALVNGKKGPTITSPLLIETTEQQDTEHFSTVLSRFEGKADLYERMLVSLKPDITKLLAVVKEGTMQQNPTKVAAAMHSIKGVASTMGAKALASRAAELEKKFKSPDVPVNEKILTNQVLDDLQRLLDSSVLQLTEQLNIYKSKTMESPKTLPVLTADEWKRELEEILPALESDNMSAINMLETLSASSSPSEQRQMEELLVQVNALDYVTAITTLKKLLIEH